VRAFRFELRILPGWIRTGGITAYNVHTRPPEKIREQFKRLGLDTDTLESTDKLRIIDWYTASLGLKPTEKRAVPSLKTADLSLDMRDLMRETPSPELLRVWDTTSYLARFNDERIWVELELTRFVPSSNIIQSTGIGGVMRGVHSDWVYKQLEGAYEGVIDFKLEEEGKTLRDVMRIRNMRNVHFDREWHELKIGENFEVTLDK
jgi:KaiC/GvpD/RAD55 family RecA-like ATPase